MKLVSSTIAAVLLSLPIAAAQQPAATSTPAPAATPAAASAGGSATCPAASASSCPVQVTVNNNPAPSPSPTPTPRLPKDSVQMQVVAISDPQNCPCPDAKQTAAIAKVLDPIVPGAHVTAAGAGFITIVWEESVSKPAIDELANLAKELSKSGLPAADPGAPKSPQIVRLTNHKAREIAHKLDNSVAGITVAAIPNDSDDALAVSWDKDALAAAVPDLLKIIAGLDVADTAGTASSPTIRLYNNRNAGEIAKILNGFQKITVAPQGNDVLVLSGASTGNEGAIDELKRYIAVLDLPRPQLALNLWSAQVSSKELADINRDEGRIRRTVNTYNSLLSDAYERGWRVIKYLHDRDAVWNWLDPSFSGYVGKRFISCSPFFASDKANSQLCFTEDLQPGISTPKGSLTRDFLKACKKGEYCLGFTFALDPEKASLTNLFVALAAADRPGPIADEIVACMQSDEPNCGLQAARDLYDHKGLYPYQFYYQTPDTPFCKFELEHEENCKSANQELAEAELTKAQAELEIASRPVRAASANAAKAAGQADQAAREALALAEKAQAAKLKATQTPDDKAAQAAAVAAGINAKSAADHATEIQKRAVQAKHLADELTLVADSNREDAAKIVQDARTKARDAKAKAGTAVNAALELSDKAQKAAADLKKAPKDNRLQTAAADADKNAKQAADEADRETEAADQAKVEADEIAAVAAHPRAIAQAAVVEASNKLKDAQDKAIQADKESKTSSPQKTDQTKREASAEAQVAEQAAESAKGLTPPPPTQADCEALDQKQYNELGMEEEDSDVPVVVQSRKLFLNCFAAELRSVFASSRRTGLMRAAIADFLFHYKMSVQYPHEFVPYDLSHSADTLDSHFHPLLAAYNRDVAALLRFLQGKLSVKTKDFASQGIISVSVISGNPASVDAKTANSFESTTPFTIAEFLNQLKSAESNTPALLKNNLTADEANAIVAAFNVQKPTNISIGRDLSLTATAFSLATGSAADLKVTMASKDDGQPQQTFPSSGTKNDINPSRVASHTVDTIVRVESTRLFELSSLSAQLTYRGNSYPVPIIGELPWIGPAFRWPGTVHRVFHRSFAIISAVVVPNAADLADGMPFTGDRMLAIPAPVAAPCKETPPKCPNGACVETAKKCPGPPSGRQPESGTALVAFSSGFHAKTFSLDSLQELPPQVREFHKEKLRCFIKNDNLPTCKGLNFENFPEDGRPGDKNAEEP